MTSKRNPMLVVQMGLTGLGAAFAIIVVAIFKYYGFGRIADLTAGLIAGITMIAIFFPIWMERLRTWWLGEEASDLDEKIGKLYQQLEQERLAKEAAETEILELRQQRGGVALENIKHLLTDGDEYRAVLERAESAESMVETMDKQLREQAEKLERDSKLTRHMLAKFGNADDAPAVEIAAGLVFPYSTKQLQAMQSAAVKYWATHDRTSPAPYGIQKEIQYYLAELTGEKNARKITELAAAIKPDNLPK